MSCACITAGAAVAPAASISDSAWRADLEVVRSALPRRHPDALHPARRAFEAAILDLEAHAAQQNADARFVGLSRVISRLGEAHTSLLLPADPAYFPLQVQIFGEELRVTRTARGFERALGARLTAIEGTPVRSVMDQVLELTSQDEDPALRRARAADYLSLGVILHGLGVIARRDRAHYQFLADDGGSFQMEMPSSGSRDETDWSRPFSRLALSDGHPGHPFWCTPVISVKAVYCDLRAARDLGPGIAAMFELIQAVKPKKLVIDLRHASGNDSSGDPPELSEPVRALPALNAQGHLFVLVGPETSAAAMGSAAQFRAATAAMLIGDALGEKPAGDQQPRELTLPNSRLLLRYSPADAYRCDAKPFDLDVRVGTTWSEYQAGIDPALEYALFGPRGLI